MGENFLKKVNHRKGYTIIETMIAVSLFLIVVMAGMGALLNANLLYHKSHDMRSIIDTLSFIMEDMSRNMRTGYNFHCINDEDFNSSILSTPESCESARAVAFEAAGGDPDNLADQWVYKIESQGGESTYNIFKSVDSGSTWVQLNSSEVVLQIENGFSVLGAESPLSLNQQQPFVSIRLAGRITYRDVVTPFNLQTSVSARVIDL